MASFCFGRCLNAVQLELAGQFLALAFAAGLGVALTCVNFYYVKYNGEDIDIGSWGSYFTTYGTLFAIISGMVLVNVLERFQQLENVVEEELNAVESIRDSLVYLHLPDPERRAFLQVLMEYLKSIAGTEWDRMAQVDQRDQENSIDSDTNKELLDIHKHIASVIQTKKESPQEPFNIDLVQSTVIPLVLELGKFRTHRLSLAEAQLPPRLKFLLLWMIFFLVIGFILLSVENVWINIFMTVAVSGAIQWLYTIISDLDHPFYGIWNVSRLQLDMLIDKFEAEIKNVDSNEMIKA